MTTALQPSPPSTRGWGVTMGEPITYEWLRSRGFRVEYPIVYSPHMLIELDRRTETYLELAPHNDVPRCAEWYCWFRNDMSHRRARFNWVRTLRTREQVELLYLACTDRKLPIEERTDDQRRKLAEVIEEMRREALEQWKRRADSPEDFILRYA